MLMLPTLLATNRSKDLQQLLHLLHRITNVYAIDDTLMEKAKEFVERKWFGEDHKVFDDMKAANST